MDDFQALAKRRPEAAIFVPRTTPAKEAYWRVWPFAACCPNREARLLTHPGMIGWSSVDAGRNVRILETLGQPPDHPVLAVFPESEYLKGVICQVE